MSTYRQLTRAVSTSLLALLLAGSGAVAGDVTPVFASAPEACVEAFGSDEPEANDQGIREISSESELVWLTTSQEAGAPWFDSHIVLANDIDLDGCVWSPIYQPGRDADRRKELEAITPGFIGTFDGNGHTIAGLVLSSPSVPRDDDGTVEFGDEILLGFFALINGQGIVRNVSFDQPTIVLTNNFFANDGMPSDGIGIVAGAVGRDRDSDSSVLSRFDNITITEGTASLECVDDNGCVVENMGGLAGLLDHAEVSNITVDMSISFLDESEEDPPVGELDRRLTLPPDGARLSAVGLLAGSASNVTASRIITTGTIQSEVTTSTVGGIAGSWGASSTLSKGHADVAIRVGGGSRNVTPELESAAGIGGIFGSLSGSDSAVGETAATGLIDIQIAAPDSDSSTTVNRIGGFVGGAFGDDSGGPSMSDILVSTTTTVSVFNPDNEPTVDVFGVGGVLGVAGAIREQEKNELSNDPPPTVTRGLAIGGVDLTGIPNPPGPEDVAAFIGKRATIAPPSVSDSYWAISQYPSLDDSFAQGKTDDALRSLSTYTNWSIAPSWNSGDTVWGICQQPEPSLPFLQWMTTLNPCPEIAGPATGPAIRGSDTSLDIMQVGPIQMTFDARVGDTVPGTTSSAWGESMLPNSAIRMEVRSTPVVLSTKIVPSTGAFEISGSLSEITPGSHRLLISGLDNAGVPWLVSLPFEVNETGHFTRIGQPSFSYGGNLAATGAFTTLLPIVVLSGVLYAIGLTALLGSQFRRTRQEVCSLHTVKP